MGHYEHSPAAQKRLEDLQRQLSRNVLHAIQDADKRWNSQNLMLSRLLELEDTITLELGTSDTTIDGFYSAE